MNDSLATRRIALSIAWSFALLSAGCGGGGGSGPVATAPSPAPAASTPSPAPAPATGSAPAPAPGTSPAPAPQVSLSAPDGPQLAVYKSFGAKQCEGGGLTLGALATQLTDAGVPVTAASCGNDGRIYLAVCGAPNGAIGILEVPQAQSAAATALGFAPLATLTTAIQFPCPPG